MQLPEDVRKLATDLIKEEFGENSIPDFDEIEAVLGEMVKWVCDDDNKIGNKIPHR